MCWDNGCIDYFALTKCHPGAVLILEVYVCSNCYICLGIYVFYIKQWELQFSLSDQNSVDDFHSDKFRPLTAPWQYLFSDYFVSGMGIVITKNINRMHGGIISDLEIDL